MRFRERRTDEQQAPEPASLATPPRASQDNLREAAERFRAAADEAIQRALSNDSERFLAANQQQGGQ